jgi:hypothetical protein
MHLVGAASVAQTVHNAPAACGAIQQVDTGASLTAALGSPHPPGRKG